MTLSKLTSAFALSGFHLDVLRRLDLLVLLGGESLLLQSFVALLDEPAHDKQMRVRFIKQKL